MSVCLRGRLFERQNLYEMIVQAQMVQVALKNGAARLVIHILVVCQIRPGGFIGRVIEKRPHKAERFLLVQNGDGDEVTELGREMTNLVGQFLPRPIKIRFQEIDFSLGEESLANRRAGMSEPSA